MKASPMKLRDQHRRLLLECHRREKALKRRRPPERPSGDYRQRLKMARVVVEHEDELQYGPRYSSSEWFEAASDAERQRFSRAVRDLVAAGFVVVTGVTGRR